MLVVSAEYFEVLGVPLISGRAFSREEGERNAEVAVVSKATADRLWPGRDPIGATFRIVEPARRSPGQRITMTTARVIGVARDVTSGAIVAGHDVTCVYLPTALTSNSAASLLLRTRSDMTALRAALSDAAAAVRGDAAYPVFPLRQVVGLQLWMLGVFSTAAAALAAIALIFAISGTFAVIAYLVSQRTREFGVRIALGATGHDLVLSVIVGAMHLGTLGIVIGGAIAFALSRLFASRIPILPTFGVQPYILGVLVIGAATLAAATIPSQRAGKIDPCEALRAE
jgi:ABC-type antimicrobial peptide transport system permease subunit